MNEPKISDVRVSVYTVPTSSPEADGTYSWNSTTMVLVEVTAGDKSGIGYTYADSSTAHLVQDKLASIIRGRSALDVTSSWHAMLHSIRNLGRPGIASMAISAIDTALWDLKAKLLGLPLCKLFGQLRDAVPVYGSGGFTSYSDAQLREQLSCWKKMGIPRVKMKIGQHPEQDIHRVRTAREAVGPDTELFVDANGAFDAKQAITLANEFAKLGVSWFEEPVSSDDLVGLHFVRQQVPPSIEVAAGEYGYDHFYFRRMLEAGAVDVLQADATRCGGFTGFLEADTLCAARNMPLSAHCAPSLHLHVCAAAQRLRHVEYFHDHARIEAMFFDGFAEPRHGAMHPDLSRNGLGLEIKKSDAQRFAA